MIEISDLVMDFGQLRAVDHLDLHIPKGEFFAFLGPNAAGKTTTIKMSTGLLQPTSGTVKICGFDIQTDPIEAKRRLGYVPDVATFYDKLTPAEFLRFISDLFSVPRDVAEKRAKDLVEQFDLGPHLSNRIENLSHGTCQRLAISSALLHEPEVIIIDEPMIGLDPIHAKTVKDELRARADAGVTILMSTHLLNIAEELADRIGIIHHGKIRAIGTVPELREQMGMKGELEEIFLAMVEEDVPEAVDS